MQAYHRYIRKPFLRMAERWNTKARPSVGVEAIASSLFVNMFGVPYTNPDTLIGQKGAGIYNQMITQDPEIKQGVREIVMGVLSSGWYINPFDDSDQSVKQAEHVECCLEYLGGRNDRGFVFQPTNQFLYELIQNPISNGHAVWEPVWIREDGLLWLDHLKSKPAEDIEYLTDEYGNLQKLVMSPTGAPENYDVDQFVIFPWLPMFQNWYGESELRCVYGAYWLSQVVLRMMGQYTERVAGGLVTGKYDRTYEHDKTAFLQMLQKLSSNGVSVYPKDLDVEIHSVTGSTSNFWESVYRILIKRIRRGLIGLTTTAEASESGDKAGQDSRDVSVKEPFLQFVSDIVAGVINTQIVQRIVDYNWMDAPGYPEFKFKPRLKENVKQNMEAAVQAWNIGTDIPRSYITEKCGIPEPEKDERFLHISQIAALKGAGGSGEATPAQLPDGIAVGVATQLAEGAVDAAASPSPQKRRTVHRGLDVILNEYRDLIATEVQTMGDQVLETMESQYDDWKRNRNLINGLKLPRLSKIQSLFNQLVKRSVKYGETTAKNEIQTALKMRKAGFAEGDFGAGDYSSDIPDDWMNSTAAKWGKDFTGAMAYDATQMFWAAMEAGKSRQEIRDMFNEKFAQYGYGSDNPDSWWNLNRKIRNAQSKAFNTARFNIGQRNNAVTGYVYVPELDDRTTDLCRSLIGQRWEKGDPAINIYYPPNHHQCRSFMDFYFAWEEQKFDPFPTDPDLQPDEGFGG